MPTTLDLIVAGLLKQAGLTTAQYDVTALATVTVQGWTIGQRMEAGSLIEDLKHKHKFDLPELDGKLMAVSRGGAATALPAGDVGARIASGGGGDAEGEGFVSVRMLQDWELPRRVDFTYYDIDKDYEQATQSATRYTLGHLQEVLTINTQFVMTKDEARACAEAALWTLWNERAQFTWSLPYKWLKLAPSDVVTLTKGGRSYRVRVVGADVPPPGGPIPYTGVEDDSAGGAESNLTQPNPGGTPGAAPPASPTLVTATKLFAWTGMNLRDQDAERPGFYLAANGATAGSWPGTVVSWSHDGQATWQPLLTITDPAPWGVTSTVLAAGSSSSAWDTTNTVDVTMTQGAPETTSDAEVLAGENHYLIGHEVVGVATVTVLTSTTYRFGRLRRGQRGTEANWGLHAIGERVVELGAGITHRIDLPDEFWGRTICVRGDTIGQPTGSGEVQCLTIGARPDGSLAPRNEEEWENTQAVLWDPPSLPNGQAETLAVTITGAKVGDWIAVSRDPVLPDGMTLEAVVSAADTIKLTLWNESGATQDLGNGEVFLHIRRPKKARIMRATPVVATATVRPATFS